MESLPFLLERANNFLNEIMEKYPHKTVFAVGHGIINKAIQSVYFNKPIHKIPKMNNAELRELKLHPERGGYFVSPENMTETISVKSKFDEFIR